MPWKPVTFDSSLDADVGGGRVLIDEGDYLGVVVGIRPSPENHNGEAYWLWQMRIKEGPSGVGRVIGNLCTYKEGAQFSNGRMFSATESRQFIDTLMDQTAETYEQYVAITERVAQKVKGKELGFFASYSTRDGGKSSEVIEVYTVEEYRARTAVTGGANAKGKNAQPESEDPAVDGAVEASAAGPRRGRPSARTAAAAPSAPAAVPAGAGRKNVDDLLKSFGLE